MSETPTVERDSSPDVDELAAALAAFQAEMPTVAKGKRAEVRTRDGGTYAYTYADLADVTREAMPHLAKNGLAFVTLPSPDGLRGMLLHRSGQWLSGILPIQGQSPQQVGSSLTYMRRYLLGCMTGLVTDDDDDGRTAEAARPGRAMTATEATQRARPADDRPPVAPPPPQRARRPREAPREPIATEDSPAPDGSVDVPLPEPDQAPAGDTRARKAMFALLREIMPGNLERDDRLEILGVIAGRETLESSDDLTREDVYRVLGFCERVKAGVAGIVRREGRWVAVSYEEPPDERG